VALRWWDLSLHSDRQEAERAIFDFILAGLGIPHPKEKQSRGEHGRHGGPRQAFNSGGIVMQHRFGILLFALKATLAAGAVALSISAAVTFH
jgi:hypothetical protein